MTIKHLLASSILDFHYLNLYRRHNNTILTFFDSFVYQVFCVLYLVYPLIPIDKTFVNELRQFGGFLWVLRFPPPIKLTVTI